MVSNVLYSNENTREVVYRADMCAIGAKIETI